MKEKTRTRLIELLNERLVEAVDAWIERDFDEQLSGDFDRAGQLEFERRIADCLGHDRYHGLRDHVVQLVDDLCEGFEHTTRRVRKAR